jgi:hypothetical protein
MVAPFIEDLLTSCLRAQACDTAEMHADPRWAQRQAVPQQRVAFSLASNMISRVYCLAVIEDWHAMRVVREFGVLSLRCQTRYVC